MNLIKINLDNNQNPVVSARDLYQGLEVTDRFSRWFERMLSYGFVEGEDFTSVESFTLVNNGAKRAIEDYQITLDMAKEISMLQRNEKSKEVRKYFIQVEKDFNSPEKVMARALLMAEKNIKQLTNENEQLQLELEKVQERASYLDLIIDCPDSITITQIAQDYGMSAKKLNQLLKSLGVQRYVNGQWILYSKHQGKGYINIRTFLFTDASGRERSKINTVWTQKGRLWLYETLKQTGTLPLIEMEV